MLTRVPIPMTSSDAALEDFAENDHAPPPAVEITPSNTTTVDYLAPVRGQEQVYERQKQQSSVYYSTPVPGQEHVYESEKQLRSKKKALSSSSSSSLFTSNDGNYVDDGYYATPIRSLSTFTSASGASNSTVYVDDGFYAHGGVGATPKSTVVYAVPVEDAEA